MLIDTHCHPFLQKEKKYSDTLNNFTNNWWFYLISVWIDLETSKKSLELSKKYNFIYSTIWIHPNYSKIITPPHTSDTPFEKVRLTLNEIIKKFKNLYLENKNKIIWIWECWYDYFHIDKNNIEQEKENQRILFEAQIELAKKLWLPVIIHSRDAFDDTLNTLKKMNCKNFLIHSFSDNLNTAKKFLDYSSECMIWFNWIVTFKNAINIQNTVKNIPLKNIVIETDSPYLTPTPLRWKKENEPVYIKHILEKIIELRNENRDKIEQTIFENSLNFFWIK